MNRFPFILVALAAACSCTWLPSLLFAAEAAVLTVKVNREPDVAVVKMEGDTAVVAVTSPKGIGGATIAPAKEWPKVLVFHLQLKGLESFSARAGDVEISGNLGDKVRELRKHLPDGKMESLPNENGMWQMTIKREKEWIQVELPTKPFRGEKSIYVHWIDFYR